MWKAQLYLEEILGEEDVEAIWLCEGLTEAFNS